MHYKQWEPTYKKIVTDFDYSVEDDEEAAEILNKLLQNNNPISINKLENLIKNKEVMIFGAGPSLEPSIIKHKKVLMDRIKIAADGATSALLKNEIMPDIIVTDLDGNALDQIRANSQRSLVIIHAHGDNIDKLKKYVPKFKGALIGTTQTNPESYENIHNFGGFTDGDRAIFLADHFNAKDIYLLGFDFGNEIGEYSFAKNKDRTLKLKKLQWCKHLIESLNKPNIHYL